MLSLFNSFSKTTQIIICVCMMIVVFVSDYLTGIELSFSIFYLLPIVLISWYVNAKYGLFFASFSAILWGIADQVGGNEYSSEYIFFFNTIVRFCIFLLISNIVSRLRENTLLISQKELLAQRSYDIVTTSQRLIGVIAKNVIAHNSSLWEWLVSQKQLGKKYPDIIKNTSAQIGANLATLTEICFSIQSVSDTEIDLEELIEELEKRLDAVNKDRGDINIE